MDISCCHPSGNSEIALSFEKAIFSAKKASNKLLEKRKYSKIYVIKLEMADSWSTQLFYSKYTDMLKWPYYNYLYYNCVIILF